MISGKQTRTLNILRCVFGHRIENAISRFRKTRARKWLRAIEGRMVRAATQGTLAAGVGLMLVNTAFAQQPSGADVVAGAAVINVSPNVVDVNAASARTIINWDQFSVGAGNTANFNLPDANSAVLNRVTSVNMPSVINGALNSNGHVHLVNPSGIMVGATGIINTNAFVASTFDIGNSDFLKGGPMTFSDNGSAAAVVNHGTINTGAGGAHLIANQIANHGSITSTGGNITMSGGGEVTLSNGVNYVQPTLETLAGGISPTAGLIQNSGAVRATGAASSGGQVYLVNPNGSILHDGTIAANVAQVASLSGSTDGSDAGSDRLEAYPTGSDRLEAYPTGSDRLAAYPTAGGHVQLEADHVTLSENSSIDVSGTNEGGTALVGGDWQGSGAMTQATSVTMQDGASIDASAIESGDGGKIVLWSDITKADSVTTVAGNLTARGGANGGDGGAVETSGHQVDTSILTVDAGADNGTGGLWLIDPYNYTVDTTAAGNISSTLNTGTSVTVTTAVNDAATGSLGGDGSDVGDITVQSAITKTAGGDATLTLKADRNVNVKESITSTSNKLNLVLWADQNGSGNGGVNFEDQANLALAMDVTTNGGHFWIGGGDGTTTWNGLTVGDGVAFGGPGDPESGIQFVETTSISTGGGSIYMAADTSNALQIDIRFGVRTPTSIDAGGGNIELLGDKITFANTSTLETSGELTIAPIGTSFDETLVWNGAVTGTDLVGSNSLAGLTINNVDSLGGLTLGKDGNATDIAVGSALDINGSVNIYGGDVSTLADWDIAGSVNIDGDEIITSGVWNVGGDVSLVGDAEFLTVGDTINTTDGDVLLKNTGTIDLVADAAIVTLGGDITLWSDSDTNGNGSILLEDNVTLDSRTATDRASNTHTSGGGDITLAGGLDTDSDGRPDGFAVSDTDPGIAMGTTGANTTTLYSGGGDLLIRGMGLADAIPSNHNTGVDVSGILQADSGTGSISIFGESADSTAVFFSRSKTGGEVLDLKSSATSGTAISIVGTATGTAGGGVNFTHAPSIKTLQATGGGDIVITGSGAGTSGGIDLFSSRVLASSGDILIDGGVNGSDIYNSTLGALAGTDVLSSSSNITVTGDSFTTFGTSTFDTTGTVTFDSFSDSFSGLYDDVNVGIAFADTISGLTIGKSSNTADVTLKTDVDIAGPVTVYGGDITIENLINTEGGGAAGDILLKATGNVVVNETLTFETSGGDITLWSDSDTNDAGYVLLNDNVTLDSRTATDRTNNTHTSGGGDITLAGGLDTDSDGRPDGFAVSDTDPAIALGTSGANTTTLYSGGGDLLIRGMGLADAIPTNHNIGVDAFGFLQADSGTGSISIIGESADSTGVFFSRSKTSGEVLDLKSSATSGTAISIVGTATGTAGGGVNFAHDTSIKTLQATGGGDIVISGSGAGTSGGIVLFSSRVLAISGDILIDGGVNGIDIYNSTLGALAGTDVLSSSSNLTVTGDSLTTYGTSTFDTTGTVTFDSFSDSFSGLYDDVNVGIAFADTISGLTIGKSSNTADVTLKTDVNIAGPVTVYGGDITIENLINTEGGGAAGDILLKATGNVVVNETLTFETSGGDITLWSDSDANDAGNVLLNDNVTLDSRTATDRTNNTHTSGGGDITLAGGLDTDSDGRPDGFAVSDTDPGVTLGTSGANTTTLYSGGGDLSIRGMGLADAIQSNHNFGIEAFGFLQADSGTGSISIIGESADSTGVIVSRSKTTGEVLDLKSSATSGTAISIVGTASGSDGVGVSFTHKTSSKSLQATGGGDIVITGSGTGTSEGIDLLNSRVLASSGDILIDGGVNGMDFTLSTIGALAGTDVLSSSSNLTVTGDSLTTVDSSMIDTTGTVTFDSFSDSFSELYDDLDTSITFADTISGLTIGKASNTADVTLSADVDVAGPVTVYGGDLNFDNLVTSTAVGGTITLNSSGTINQGSSAAFAAANLNITTDDGNSGTSAADVILQNDANEIATLTADVDGSLSYRDSNALSISRDTTNGITAQGTILVETLTGDLTINDNIVTTDDSVSAVILNAGKNTAAGTSTGGNIIANSSPTITVGSGGRATLYSGDIDDSTGLTSLVQSGSGRFRYNSDEAASNFTSALSTGVYGIYREQPTLTVTAADTSMTYADVTPSFTFNINGKNGDTAAQSLSTDPTITIGGSKSTSNNWIAGDHDLTSSGAVSGLGYALAYGTGTLTVNQKASTISGLNANNRTYDGTTAATVDHSGVIFGGMATGDVLTAVDTVGAFADKNVGSGKAVALSGTTYGGADVGNYTFTDQAASTADISQLSIALNGFLAADKTYNGSAVASITNSGSLNGVVGGDTVNVSNTGATFSDKNAGTGKTVTLNGISLSGTDASNYSIGSTVTGTADIAQKAIAITGFAANDKSYNGTTTASVSSLGALSNVVSGDTVGFTNTGATFADKNVGTGKTVTLNGVVLDGVDAGNYLLSGPVTGLADITAKAITIIGFVALDKTYDGNANAVIDETGTLSGIVSGDTVGFSNSGATFSDKYAATNKTVMLNGIALTGSDSSNYLVNTVVTDSADIAQKAISVNGFLANNKVYNGDTLASIDSLGSLTGIVGSDVVGFTNSGATFSDEDAGTGKTVTLNGVSLNGTDASNYTISGIISDLADITAKAITVSGFVAQDKTYDGDTVAIVDTFGSLNGVITGDTVGFSHGNATFSGKNAGTEKTVTLNGVALTGIDAGNYSIGGATSDLADITLKEISITGFNSDNKTYNGNVDAVVSAAGSLSGLISGDAVGFSNSGATFSDKNVGTGKTVTLNGISLTGADASNYFVGTAPTDLSDIAQKAITIIGFDASDKSYDSTTTASIVAAGTLDGVEFGDSIDFSFAGATFADKNADTGKTVTLNGITLTGTDAGNYSLNSAITDLADITQKAITVIGFGVDNKTYDRNTTASITAAGTLDGVVSGDTVGFSNSGATFADANVGTDKTVTLNGRSLTGIDAGNYVFDGATTVLADIAAKAITITGFGVDNKTYNGNTDATISATGTLDGVISGDTVSFSNTGATFSDRNVGTGKTVTLNGVTLTGADAGNYLIAATTSLADILQKAVTVGGVTVVDKMYDGTTTATADSTGVTFTGIVSDDDLTIINVVGVFADKNAGSGKAVTLSGSTYGGDDVGNYSITDQTATTGTITPKSLTINLHGEGQKVYDGTTMIEIGGVTATLAGTLAGDDITVDSGMVTGYVDKNVGTSKLVQYTGFGITGTDAGNYNLASNQAESTGAITFKNLTVSGITANNKIYDGTATAVVDLSNVVLAGVIAGDDLSASDTAGAFANENVGNDKTVTLSGTTYSGADVSNYNITDQVNAIADIAAKSVTVSGLVANDRAYDGTTVASVNHVGVTFDGIITGDDVSASGTSGNFADKNAGTNKSVTLSGTTYGGTDAGNYQFTQQTGATAEITQKALTLENFEAGNKVYNGDATASILNAGTLTGVVSGDNVNVSNTGATFDSRHAGSDKTVTLNGLSISGTDSANYSFGSGVTDTASITQKAATVSGLSVSDRVYDGSAVAAVDHSGVTFTGIITGDTVSAADTIGVFADKNVGADKSITLSGTTYAGTDAGNYSFTHQTSTTASISRLSSVAWIGGLTGDWSNPANWAGGAIPDLANVANVIIPNAVTPTFDAAISGPVDLDSLSGGNLQLDSGTLNVANNATLDDYIQTGGIFDVGADFTANSFSQTGGTTTVGGDFATTHAFDQTSPGNLSVTGNADITHTAGELSVAHLSGNNVSLNSTTGGVSLGEIGSAGTLNVSAGNGDIAQLPGSAIVTDGEATFAATGDVTLGNADNDFKDTINITGTHVTVTDGVGGLELGDIMASGTFDATSTDGPITQTADGSIEVAGAASLAASDDGNPDDITLTGDSNDFQAAVNAAGNNVAITDAAGGLELGDITANGTFDATSTDGPITQSADGSIEVAGIASLAASNDGDPADITLTGDGNDFQAAVNLDGNNVAVNDGVGGLELGDIMASGTFDATSTDGPITQTADGSIEVAGVASLAASNDGDPADITLTGDSNDFKAAVNLDGNNVAVTDAAGGLELGDITAAGTLDATSTDGPITQTADGSIEVTGIASLAASDEGDPADITLTGDSNDFKDTVNATGNNVAITDAVGGLELGDIMASGTFDATSTDGPITQSADGSIEVAGVASLAASDEGDPADITLTGDSNDFQAAVNLDGNNVAVNDGVGGLELGDIMAAGTLDATSTDGPITQTADGSIEAAGVASLAASDEGDPADITLTGDSNDFKDTVNATGNNVAITDAVGGLELGDIMASGTFDATSTDGPITQAADGSIEVAGVASLAASKDGNPDDITLTGDSNNFKAAVNLDGNNVAVNDGVGGLELGDIMASGTFDATSTDGPITQSADGSIEVAGVASLAASKDGNPDDITLTGDSNDFKDTVNAAGNNVAITDAAGGLELGDITAAGTLDATSTHGPLTQSAGGSIEVAGVASLIASKYGDPSDIVFTGANNDFQATVNAAGNNVGINNGVGGLELGDIMAAGNFDATSTDGPITQTADGSIEVAGVTSLVASKDGDPSHIALTGVSNDFKDTVNAAGNNVAVNDGVGGLELGDITAAGTLHATSTDGAIVQSAGGSINVAGHASLAATRDGRPAAVDLSNGVNSFSGTVNIDGSDVQAQFNNLTPNENIQVLAESSGSSVRDTNSRYASKDVSTDSGILNVVQRYGQKWADRLSQWLKNPVTSSSVLTQQDILAENGEIRIERQDGQKLNPRSDEDDT